MGHSYPKNLPTQRPDLPTQWPDWPTRRSDSLTQRPDLPTRRPDLPTRRQDLPTRRPDFPTQQQDSPTRRPDSPTSTKTAEKPTQKLRLSFANCTWIILTRKCYKMKFTIPTTEILQIWQGSLKEYLVTEQGLQKDCPQGCRQVSLGRFLQEHNKTDGFCGSDDLLLGFTKGVSPYCRKWSGGRRDLTGRLRVGGDGADDVYGTGSSWEWVAAVIITLLLRGGGISEEERRSKIKRNADYLATKNTI